MLNGDSFEHAIRATRGPQLGSHLHLSLIRDATDNILHSSDEGLSKSVNILTEADIVNTMSDGLALLKYTVGMVVCVPSVQQR